MVVQIPGDPRDSSWAKEKVRRTLIKEIVGLVIGIIQAILFL